MSQQKGIKTKHDKPLYLFQDDDNVSFLQIQLVLGFALVVKHDLATLGHCRDTPAGSMSDMKAEPLDFLFFFRDEILQL